MKRWNKRARSIIALVGLAVMLGSGSHRATTAAPTEQAVVVEALAATWVKPDAARIAVLIVAGSGPTDRDGNSQLGLKTDAYKQLAAALARAGIASLRYDKRGVGASKTAADGGPFEEKAVTIDTYAADTAKLAAWMGRQPGIASVAIAGHSEGGLLALLAARQQKVDKLVLLTAAGRPLGQVLRQQFDRQPMPEEMKAEIERVLGVLEKGGDPGALKPPLDALFRVSVQPFLRSVLAIDPAALVKAGSAPVLVIGGGSDLQIGRFDYNALEEARAGVKGHWEPRLTHTLKQQPDEEASQQKAYLDPSVPIMPAVVDTIVGFLKE